MFTEQAQGGSRRRCDFAADLRASPLVSARGSFPVTVRVAKWESPRPVTCVHLFSSASLFLLRTVRTQERVCVRIWLLSALHGSRPVIPVVPPGAHIGSVGPAVPLQAGYLILSLLTSLPSFVEHFCTFWFNPPSPSSILLGHPPAHDCVCFLMDAVSGPGRGKEWWVGYTNGRPGPANSEAGPRASRASSASR